MAKRNRRPRKRLNVLDVSPAPLLRFASGRFKPTQRKVEVRLPNAFFEGIREVKLDGYNKGKGKIKQQARNGASHPFTVCMSEQVRRDEAMLARMDAMCRRFWRERGHDV